jgi:hypothetical protein
MIRSCIRFFGSKNIERILEAACRCRQAEIPVMSRHQADIIRGCAAEARPLPACSALPPSAPEPPTLTPQPGKEVFTRGQKQGGSGLRVPVRRLLQVVARSVPKDWNAETPAVRKLPAFITKGDKTAPPAAAPAARAVAGVAALRPSRGARASTPPPTGARKLGFKPVLFLLLGLVLILRFLLDGSL